MNTKTLAILGAFVLLVAVVAVMSKRDAGPEGDSEIGEPLLPGLAEALDSVDAVAITSAEGLVSLARQGDEWGVGERAGYPADFADLSALTTALSEARFVERKTARAENLPRMGLEDVSASGSEAVVVELSGGGSSWSVMLGGRASGRTGQYARFPPETQVWQIDKFVPVEKGPTNWLDQTIINVLSDRVVRVVVEHPDGEQLDVAKQDGDFRVPDLAEDEELKYSTVASELSRALVNMRMTDVTSGSTPAWTAPVVSHYYCKDGLKVSVEAVQAEGKYYVRLRATLDDSVADVAAEIRAEAAGIEARTDRTFEVAQFTFKEVTKRRADLMKPPAEDEPDDAS